MLVRLLWITGHPDLTVDPARFEMQVETTAVSALERLELEEFDVILATFPLPDCSSEVWLLEELQQRQGSTPVIIESSEASVSTVVKLMHLGAFHVLQGGDASSVLWIAGTSKGVLQKPAPEPWRRFLVGESNAMQQISDIIRLVAPRRSTVLITGETGTGKEMVARAIHAASTRAHLPMISINCTAFPETLLEAELFGHVKGAFTGATGNRVGRFEQAHRGTIFLDEVGDMPLNLQAKLLRVLQEREIQRLGSSETVHVDVRVIAATNTDLSAQIRAGKFREDLYYRLNVVPIAIPALRERHADIPALVHHFLDKICRQEDLVLKQISPETLKRLSSHDWPGNVRELENAVEKALVLSGFRAVLQPGDFHLPRACNPTHILRSTQGLVAVPDHGLDYEQTVGTIERNILQQALEKTKGNKKMAAEMLGLKRTTLSAKLKSLTALAG